MAKIGDLWVFLGLQADKFKKGLADAKNQVEGFGSRLGKMKASAVAVWAAIGTAVGKFANDLIHATNRINDSWAKTMSSIKAGWHTVLAEMSNTSFDTSGSGGKVGNAIKNEVQWWKRLFGNVKDAGKAAAEATEAFDAEFELVNSIRLQRLDAQNELNELYAMIRDTTLKPQDRAAAIEKYKAILEPLANAEIEVYTNMLDKAIEEWQAGNSQYLSRKYSNAEVNEFFTNYGTDKAGMTAKYGELASVYENRKNDKTNQVIFDILAKLKSAQSEISNVEKEMTRSSLSIKKALREMFYIDGKSTEQYLKEQVSSYSKEMAEDIRQMNEEFAEIEDIEIDMSDIDNEMKAFLDEWKKDVDTFSNYNRMLEDSIVNATANGLQAFTDMMFGIEGADTKQVMAAFLSPFADTMKQMGSMIMAEGVAMDAFKKSFKNPYAAIAAGAALIAVGSAVSSGLQRLTQNPTGGSAGSSASTGTSSTAVENYESTLTVEVVGRISGNDIVISGKKTNASNAR